MDVVNIEIRDTDGFVLKEQWKKAEVSCPLCREEKVFCETGNGDYYLGIDYICIACGCTFNLPCLEKLSDLRSFHKHRTEQRIKFLTESSL